MNKPFELLPFTPDDAAHVQQAAALWNAACGAGLAIRPEAVAFSGRPATGAVTAGRLAFLGGQPVGGQPVGFVLAGTLPADPATAPPEQGWIDALVVRPDCQRQGVGRELLAWAEHWLTAQGCTRVQVGGGLRHLAPGVPVELNTAPFFLGAGYLPQPHAPFVWDMARDLGDYPAGAHGSPFALPARDLRLAPMSADQGSALFAFLHREFPRRWRFEAEEWLRSGGDPASYLLLWQGEAEVIGFCRVRKGRTLPVQSGFGQGFGKSLAGLETVDGPEPLDHYFLHGLPQPWGQLGTVGIAVAQRGRGLSLALLDDGLRRLQAAGVRGCVIDWTGLLGLYGRFGFQPYRSYLTFRKVL